ncbi:MAG: phosphotriesterase-related protein [Gordonia sp. (in: high G+C Gram-positive bacteria)]|uniref:phosphotriesterase family protein n=1 Tax=Gordonia sp. (in: high G+C Gram-positive bacteria) TaxID=84139 RepID=UPI0039E2612E
MTTINTVTGPISADALGTVLPHEYVILVDETYRMNYLRDWDEDVRVAAAVRELTELKSLGVDTIFDLSVVGAGRNVARVKRIAEQIDLNILVATGLFTYNDLPFQFHYNGPGLGSETYEPMVDMFVEDLTTGVAGTDVKAALLTCVIESEGLTSGVERILRAVGKASARTGAPVLVHTNPHTRSGLVAQRVLTEEGVDLRRVILGQCGDTTDVEFLTQLADAGSILALDRFGIDVLLPYQQRLQTLLALIERGYADHVVLSQMAFSYCDWFDMTKLPLLQPDWNYRQITGRVVPDLLDHGVSQDVIDTMLIDVPRRFITGDTSVRPGPSSPISSISGLSPDK